MSDERREFHRSCGGSFRERLRSGADQTQSKRVAPGRTTFPPKTKTGTATKVAASCRHPEFRTGKEEGRVKKAELGKRPGTSDASGSVAPGRTKLRREARGAGRETGPVQGVATARRHVEPRTPETTPAPGPHAALGCPHFSIESDPAAQLSHGSERHFPV